MVDVSSQPLNSMPLKLYWCHLKGFWSCKLPPITSSLPTWCPGVVVVKKYRMAKFILANITAFQTHSSSQTLLKFDCWILFYKFHTKLIFNRLAFSQILSNISTKLMSTSNFSNNNDKNNTAFIGWFNAAMQIMYGIIMAIEITLSIQNTHGNFSF